MWTLLWIITQPAPSRGLFDGLHHPDLIKADQASTCAGAGRGSCGPGLRHVCGNERRRGDRGPISQVCDDWLQRALCPAAACQPRYVVTNNPPAGVRHIWRRRPTTAFSLMKAPSIALYLCVLYLRSFKSPTIEDLCVDKHLNFRWRLYLFTPIYSSV